MRSSDVACRHGGEEFLLLMPEATLDAAMIIALMLAVPAMIWPMILPVAASMARITFTARTLRPVLAG